ncbi:MAG: sn-glycerol-3-phosphate ABC transporter ATP-binding protein UgpC [Deltaproteobacteria bacterium]|nr:sn-glycerol-3-phosphate ABC transporter ATP-binding protein UgpC [Deltaproteobacteria bacterium]
MAEVTLKNLVKRYGDAPPTVKGVSLTVKDGEFLVLVGPSGCGKSTTLRMIAGLEEITEGELLIGPKRMNEVHPKDRDIAMVFQSYALYPHMSVRDNMAFGLKMRGMPKHEIDVRVDEAAKMLDLTHLLERKPKALSGGQRQRVAMGRAIVRRAPVFLFDEPLSNLDAKLRVQMRAEIARIHKKLKPTIVYVTHDQTEAMTLADRIAVLHAGYLQQLATPLELYERPANRFVAGFIGSPSMNFCDGTAEGGSVEAFGTRIPLPPRLSTFKGSCVAGIRPEHFSDTPAEGKVAVPLTIELVEPLGSETYLTGVAGDARGARIMARVGSHSAAKADQKLQLHFDPKNLHLFAPGDNGAAL